MQWKSHIEPEYLIIRIPAESDSAMMATGAPDGYLCFLRFKFISASWEGRKPGHIVICFASWLIRWNRIKPIWEIFNFDARVNLLLKCISCSYLPIVIGREARGTFNIRNCSSGFVEKKKRKIYIKWKNPVFLSSHKVILFHQNNETSNVRL